MWKHRIPVEILAVVIKTLVAAAAAEASLMFVDTWLSPKAVS